MTMTETNKKKRIEQINDDKNGWVKQEQNFNIATHTHTLEEAEAVHFVSRFVCRISCCLVIRLFVVFCFSMMMIVYNTINRQLKQKKTAKTTTSGPKESLLTQWITLFTGKKTNQENNIQIGTKIVC